MSTKFYNAFILKDKSEMKDIVKWNQSLIKKIQAEQKQLYGKLIMNHLATAFDRKAAKLPLSDNQKEIVKNKINPIRTVVDHIEQEIKSAQESNFRSPQFDLSCSVLYIPHKNDTIIKVFSEQNSYLNIITSNLADFSYWNNSDKPDEISNSEWKERKKFIDSLKNINLSENGLTSNLTKDIRYISFYREDFKDLLKLQQSLESRKLAMAKSLDLRDFDIVSNKEVKEYLKTDKLSLAFERLDTYIKSDKSKENIEKHLKSLKLKESFKEEDLIKND